MKYLSQIEYRLKQFSIQAATLDAQRGAQRHILFDEKLFTCRARLLVPFVNEADKTFKALIREQESNQLSPQRALYLTQTLMDQISAISKELAANAINYQANVVNTLHQDLLQHIDWEKRLIELVKENQLACVESNNKQLAEHKLKAAKDRLKRCQESKSSIEKKIAEQEGYNAKT